MTIKRTKGHGRRATLLLRIPAIRQDWHIKLRPRHERGLLEKENEKIKCLRSKLPVPPSSSVIATPIVSMLLTRTIEGFPAHKLVGRVSAKELVNMLFCATKQIQRVPVDRLLLASPAWTNKRTSIEQIDSLDSLKNSGKELHPDFHNLSTKQLKKIIENGPDQGNKPTLVHGDLCMPNLLFSENGNLVGVIDLGQSHVGDTILDIALMSWCIEANMGKLWADYYLDLFGLKSHKPAIQYYRLAYDLSLNFPHPWSWINEAPAVDRRKKIMKAIV